MVKIIVGKKYIFSSFREDGSNRWNTELDGTIMFCEAIHESQCRMRTITIGPKNRTCRHWGMTGDFYYNIETAEQDMFKYFEPPNYTYQDLLSKM